MGSSRFPGKMMAPLHGLPVLEWVLRRCDQAKSVTKVVLATSNLPRDKILVEHANNCGFDAYTGDEADVLGRFAGAAKQFDADIVVRICGDRPLVAPEAIDAAVDLFELGGSDLTFNHIAEEGENWPRGFGSEVLSADLLFKMAESYHDDYYREHVTSYLWQHRDDYVLKPTRFALTLPDSHNLRFDVDTPEDFHFLESLEGLAIDMTIEDILRVYSEKVINQ